MFSLFTIILAALGLSFLVFIHELGHYLMARRTGMRVEVFSIGFGKAFYTWERKGVKWQVCYLLFGGYVKIAGMEREGAKEPHDIAEGFYSKKPLSRILVALMGPIVNIVFAFLVFALIWGLGGRVKPFSQFTQLIGSMDPKSELYELGVRPGDQLTYIDGHAYEGFRDLIYAGVLKTDMLEIRGHKIDYPSGQKEVFDYKLEPYAGKMGKDFKSLGVLAPASYLLYNPLPGDPSGQLVPGSPMASSGIQHGDRIVWVQGELIFSLPELMQVVNEPKTLLTVEREGQVFLSKVPRLQIKDLRLSRDQRDELRDWHYALGLKAPFEQFYAIPFQINSSGMVEKEMVFFDEKVEERLFHDVANSSVEIPLKAGDRIVAVDGVPVQNAMEFLRTLQTKRIVSIVQEQGAKKPMSWKGEDGRFQKSVSWSDIQILARSVGLGRGLKQMGDLRILNPIEPKTYAEIESLFEKMGSPLGEKSINAGKERDPKKKAEMEKNLENARRTYMLGIMLQDRAVVYNPNPATQFGNVLAETWRTLSSLFSGALSPKWMSGPVGIIHALHLGYQSGFKEALFWLGVISLNLGILNLLPIPVLDGGHICFSLYEMVTRRRIRAKVMERLIIPFIFLLVALFVYLTYQDLSRLFLNIL